MRACRSFSPKHCLFIVSLIFTSPIASAQTEGVRPRITEAVDDTKLTLLKGNTHPLARPEFDRGPAPPTLPMERMLLVLTRSTQQEAALEALLNEQQSQNSPNYHKWLTPEQFGLEFGPASADIQSVTNWLASQGFQVNKVSNGRTVIEFSGDAGLVRNTFHTEIHKFVVNGEEHWANVKDPQIPNALASVVAGVASLHNFFKKPQLIKLGQMIRVPYRPGKGAPAVTFANGLHALGPADFSTIYNINSVYQSGMTGAGRTIAVVGRSNINVQDVNDFRNVFNLPFNQPTVVLNGPDPGNLGGLEEVEALLDNQWSGAIGQGATVKFVVSQSTETDDGVDLSVLYIVENNLADIMTESFGACENFFTAAQAQAQASIAEQAAAQGITYLAATGDTGAEGCDNLSETVATGPISVSLPASTPFTLAVGGTIFNENGNDSKYWNSTNSTTNGFESAKSYIPEDVWNESCTASQCGSNANIAAGGGGASSIFAKPAWQSGVPSIPADGHRDLPDVSLSAAIHDPYLVCFEGSCIPNAQGFIQFLGVGGTSASTPSFAGIMALVDQATNSRQGQANYVLYKLAAKETLSSCNASNTSTPPASTCVFNDTTVGNNAVPGEVGFGTATAKYQSTTGYDLATGLGSVNVANLVSGWKSVTFTPTTTTLTLSPMTITHGQSVSVSVQVAPKSGTGTPTGDVSLIGTPVSGSAVGIQSFTLNSNASVSGTTTLLPGGTSYSVTAHYAGDATFGASDSAPASVTVSPEPSTAKVSVFTVDPSSGNVRPATTAPYGTLDLVRVDIVGASGQGIPTGFANLTDTIAPVFSSTLNSKGYFEEQTPSFSVGAHGFQASYNGDLSFAPSSSAVIPFTVTQATTTTTLTATPSSIQAGNSVTLTAFVDTHSLGTAPSGTVSFMAGGAPLSGTPSQQNTTDANGFSALQVTLVTTPTATETVTAQYSGDANYTTSASQPVTVTLIPSFTLAPNPASISISAPGQSGASTIAVTETGGFTGAVSLTCSVTGFALVDIPTCSLSPASVNLTATTASATTTLTVFTTAPQTAWLIPSSRPPVANRLLPIGAIAMACFFLLLISAPKRRWVDLVGLIALAYSLGGCGGGSRNPGTTPGTYTATVTATGGGTTHTTTVTVTVQ